MARTTVLRSEKLHGSSACPGRHSQTVPVLPDELLAPIATTARADDGAAPQSVASAPISPPVRIGAIDRFRKETRIMQLAYINVELQAAMRA